MSIFTEIDALDVAEKGGISSSDAGFIKRAIVSGDKEALESAPLQALRSYVRGAFKMHYASKNNWPICGTDVACLRKEQVSAYVLYGVMPSAEAPEAPEAPKPIPATKTASKAPGALERAVLDLVGEDLEKRIAELENKVQTPAKQEPTRVEIVVTKNGESKALPGRQHWLMPLVLHALEAKTVHGEYLNVGAVGAAGSGKTTAFIKAAEALDIPFEVLTGNKNTSKSDILGFVDASGKYQSSILYRCMKHGKMAIYDEFDGMLPGISMILNAAVANRIVTFPNGETVKANDDFRAVFAMNTNGLGATENYSRNRQDGATLDRLCFINFTQEGKDYDEALESGFFGIEDKQPDFKLDRGGLVQDANSWLERVRKVRHAVKDERLSFIISPRASLYGHALAERGVGLYWLDQCVLFKGMTPEQEKRVRAKAGI